MDDIDITVEYLSDLVFERLPLGTKIKCTRGFSRKYGETNGFIYEIQKAPEQPKEDIKDFNLTNRKLT